MATITEHKLKNGKKSYTIQVKYKGKFQSTTWKRPDNLKENEVKRELERLKVDFDRKVRIEMDLKNENITFEECAEQWLIKTKSSMSKTHYHRSVEMVNSLNQYFGKMLLKSIKLKDVENYIFTLNNKEIIINKVRLIKPLDDIISNYKIKDICSSCGFSKTTFQFVRQGKNIDIRTANAICKFFNITFKTYFENDKVVKHYELESKLKFKRTLSAILNFAVKHEYIDKNYASSIYIGKLITGEKREKIILTEEETNMLNHALNNENNLKRRLAILLLFHMGLRIGEVSGLEWKDVDFENNLIKIERSVAFIPHKGEYVKSPKTKNSKRKLKMPTIISNLLTEYKKLYDEEKQKLGSAWVDKDRIICRYNGDTTTPSTYGNWLTEILVKNEIRVVSPHSLRHTCITSLLREKVPVTIVSKWAGHASTAMTLNTYAHYLPEDEDVCANALNKIFS